MKRYIAALLLALPLALGACSGGIPVQVQTQVAQIEEASKPRQRVEVMARVLKETKEGLAAELKAGRLTRDEFVGTEPAVLRSTAALEQAGQLLHAAADERSLAETAVDPGNKLQYQSTAAANEALAISRTNAAETDIAPLRALLSRARGVPVAVLVK